MTSIQLFNELNGKEVSRNYLQEILQQAKTENQTSVIYRISKILNDYPNVQHFDINIVQYPQGLAGAMHTGDYREALDDCGRLKKGWKFVKGNVIKVEKKEKKEVSKPKKQEAKTEKNATEDKKTCKTCGKKSQEETNQSEQKYSKSYFEKDLDYKSVYNSYYWRSQDPERNAKREIEDWGKDFYNLYNSSVEQAQENGVLDKYNEAFDKEYERLLKLQKEIISIRSKTFSQAVTGGAGISARKQENNISNQKKESEKNSLFSEKYNQLEEKLKKIATNTPENQYEKGEVISSTDKHAIEKLEQKLREVEAEKDFIQRAEKAAKEWKKNNDFGVFAKYNIDDKNANEIIDNLNRHGWALVGSVTNRNAEIRRIKQRIEGLKKQSEQENTNIEFDGGKIVFDTQEHRIKILFDEIPSAEVRNALKKRAFKWSPKNKAWQRVYTTDAKYAVDNLFEKDGVLKKKVKIEKEPTVKQTDGLAAPTAQSSETIAFNKEILKAKREGLNTDVLLKLGKAKGELKKIVGNKEMRISQATIKKAMTKDESHIITWENLVNLPDYLNNPLAIFKSKTAGFVVLTEIINAKNKPVIAPLHIVKKGNYIEVKSLYSRKNDSTYQNWVKEDLLLYINKKSDLAFKTMGTIPNLDSKSQDKNTKKSVSNKKTAKNFGLGLPLTNEIRKKAFTDKGKLRKGWSFTDDKFLTNGKDFYIPHNKPPIFYEEIIKEIEDNSNKKLKELKKLFNEKDADYRKRREIAEKIKKKLGLSAPVVETPQELTQVFVEESPLTPEGGELVTESKQVDDQPSKQTPSSSERIGVRKNSLAEQLANAPEQSESYQIDRVDMAQFLGDMEIKNTDSLVITLTGGQGSGKTRFAFQFMNDLAQRYKVGHISIEEHPQSRLYIEKVHQYLNPTALNNIEAHDVRSLSEIDKVIRENEVIVIDSFQKIKEIDGKFEVDKDLRKKYNGKLFLVIFQQTTDGKMRGGSKSQFDGDIILFTEKFPNYQENYVYPDKNRYNHIPADQLRYNIFQQRLLPIETEEQTTENQVYDVIY